MLRRTFTAVAVTTATVLGSMVVAVPASADDTRPIPNTKPDWVATAKHLGSASGSARVSARVYLAPRGGLPALRAAALAASTPGSAGYGHFVTPRQFQAKYGATDAMVRTVRSYLTGKGLSVTSVGADNRFLVVRGTAATAKLAFGATIARYSHRGRTVQAPSSSLTMPAGVAKSVTAVTGLDTSPKRVKPLSTPSYPPSAGYRNARPCSLYYGQVAARYQADFKTPLPKFHGKTLPYAVCGYTGPQLRSAYENNGEVPGSKPAVTLTGAGVRIGILDAYDSPTIQADAKRYATNHGDSGYAKGQYVTTRLGTFTGGAADVCDASGWYGEQTLDVEASHAMAADATIHYYAARSCNDSDFLDALARIAKDDSVDIVSNSWGSVEEGEDAAAINAYGQVFAQSALEGISVLFSSGDSGDEVQNTAIKQADYPASDPLVTAVGGTATGIDAAGALSLQTGWGTDTYSLAANGASWTPGGYLYGAGGGASSLFNQPAYQRGVAPGPYRQVPDVAMDADPTTGMLIGQTQQFTDVGVAYGEYRIGGTSLASPLLAGFTALSLQYKGKRAGLLNPVIYAKRGQFTDIAGTPKDAGNVRVNFVNGENADKGLSYLVRTFNQDSSLPTTAGYDNVTGVGVPEVGWLTALK